MLCYTLIVSHAQCDLWPLRACFFDILSLVGLLVTFAGLDGSRLCRAVC